MKIKLLSKLALATLLTTSVFAGERGNGGDAVVCFTPDGIQKGLKEQVREVIKAQDGRDPLTQEVLDNIIKPVRLLDIYEMNESSIELINPVGKDSNAIIDDRWEALSQKVNLRGVLSSTIDKVIFRSRLNGVHEVYDDGRKANLPNHCMLVQLAYMSSLGELFQVEYDQRLYNMLPEIDKAALRFHEWVYTYSGHRDSRQTRAIVGKIFENNLQDTQSKILGSYFRNLLAGAVVTNNTSRALLHKTSLNLFGTEVPAWEDREGTVTSTEKSLISHPFLNDIEISTFSKKDNTLKAKSTNSIKIQNYTISPLLQNYELIIKSGEDRIIIESVELTTNFEENNYKYYGDIQIKDQKIELLGGSKMVRSRYADSGYIKIYNGEVKAHLLNSNIQCENPQLYPSGRIKSCYEIWQDWEVKELNDIKLFFLYYASKDKERPWDSNEFIEYNSALQFHENGTIKSYITAEDIQFDSFTCRAKGRIDYNSDGEVTYCFIKEGPLSWDNFYTRALNDSQNHYYRGASILANGIISNINASFFIYKDLDCESDRRLVMFDTGVPQNTCYFKNENTEVEIDNIEIKQYAIFHANGNLKESISAKTQRIKDQRVRKNRSFKLDEQGNVTWIRYEGEIEFEKI